METETSGPAHARRAGRHPGEQARATQEQGTEPCARGAEREGTIEPQREGPRTEKTWVLSLVEGAGARVRALCR
jgi:hypothetical protein